MFDKLRTKIHNYHENHFTSAEKADVAASGGAGTLITGLLLAPIFPPLALIIGTLGIASVAIFGVAAALDYRSAKKLVAQETASAKNEMHQTIEGPGWAVYQLKQAQAKIFNAAHSDVRAFNSAAKRRAKIDQLIADAQPAADAVTVKSSEWSGVSKDKPEFLIPSAAYYYR